MTSQQRPDPAAVALVAAYQQQTQTLRDQVEGFITALWASLSAYRATQAAAFAGEAVPMVLGAQQHMVALTMAFLTEQRRTVGIQSRMPTPNLNLVTGSGVRNGTSMTEVYGRPFHLVWRDLAAAQTKRDAHYQWAPTPASTNRPALPPADYVDKAINAGLARAVNLAKTDLQLAKTHTAQRVIQNNQTVVGYRRVLEGELSCAKCIVASTQIYHRATLMPIHPGCDCGISEVYDDVDLANVINQQNIDLPAAHATIEAAFGTSNAGARLIPGQGDLEYRHVLVEHQDGEIGPILAIRGQHFTGPAQLATAA